MHKVHCIGKQCTTCIGNRLSSHSSKTRQNNPCPLLQSHNCLFIFRWCTSQTANCLKWLYIIGWWLTDTNGVLLSSRRSLPAGRDNCIWLDVEDTRWGLENKYESLIVQYRASTALQKDRPFRDAFCRPLIKVTDVIWQCHSLKWDQSMILHCHSLVGGNNSWCRRETVKYYRIGEFRGWSLAIVYWLFAVTLMKTCIHFI